MGKWPLSHRIRIAAVAVIVLVTLGVVVFTGGSPAPEPVFVPVSGEDWEANRPVGAWSPVEADPVVAGLAAPLSAFTLDRVAAYDVPAGTVITEAMLTPLGTNPQGQDVVDVWVDADTSRWRGGATIGGTAVFASAPGGCAVMELELADVSDTQVAVEVDPALFATLVAGEPWTVWAAPDGGWSDLCPPGTSRTDIVTTWVDADTSRWRGGATVGGTAVFSSSAGGCAVMELELVDVSDSQVAVEVDPALFATLVAGEPWTVWAAPAGGWPDVCPPGTNRTDIVTTWIEVDSSRWHGSSGIGDTAVFAEGAGECASVELVIVAAEGLGSVQSRVAVEITPDLFVDLLDGEPWTVWAAPAGGWPDQCGGPPPAPAPPPDGFEFPPFDLS